MGNGACSLSPSLLLVTPHFETPEITPNLKRDLTIADILQIAPPRKLPSLYVLDSIVKNVGTPYTVYLGKNLYSTFMGAYTLVDSGTRKAMEAMLKTWKEPVPGSLDPRPVFQVEETRPIENALIKARTAMLQSQQRQPGVLGQVPSPGLYRQTPTPPQYASRFAPPQYQQQNSTPQPFLQQQVSLDKRFKTIARFS